MENKTIFVIKNESADDFFSILDKSNNMHDRINPYSFMKDDMILPIHMLQPDVKAVVFELQDVSRGSNRVLVNIYEYEVLEYDSVSYKLSLRGFSVNLI